MAYRFYAHSCLAFQLSHVRPRVGSLPDWEPYLERRQVASIDSYSLNARDILLPKPKALSCVTINQSKVAECLSDGRWHGDNLPTRYR
jgi:hypothetical protein